MTAEQAITILTNAGYVLKEQKRLGNNLGDQLVFTAGEIVNIFDKGTYSVQGKNSAPTKKLLQSGDVGGATAQHPDKVFVVYGHDITARTQLEAMLRRWNIEPLILDQLPSEGQTVIEKLENYTQKAHYAVVLATPDDEGNPVGKPDERQCRARQNVVLELGMLLATLGRQKVAILIKGQKNMEKPSDINGLMYIPFADNVEDAKTLLYKELCSAGFVIPPNKL